MLSVSCLEGGGGGGGGLYNKRGERLITIINSLDNCEEQLISTDCRLTDNQQFTDRLPTVNKNTREIKYSTETNQTKCQNQQNLPKSEEQKAKNLPKAENSLS